MFQPEFTKNLLKECRKYSIHTCLDTSGYTPWKSFRGILDYVDVFSYDIKETDTKRHEDYTGVPFEPILENLKLLDATGGKIALRCPIIPGLNNRAEHINAIVDIAMSLKNLESIECLNYHSLGVPKLEKLGRKNEMLKYSKDDGLTFKEAVMILFSKLPEEKIKNAKP
jgi:pyruvate formate lyase activating enzyme